VTFFVRVNKTQEDVLKVAQSIGCNRASDQLTVEGLFEAKFAEALKTVGKRMNFEELYTERDHFKDAIIEVIGKDLNGFVMDDCAIDYLEQTPIESLDKDNIMDAEGIRKITDLTVIQNVKTNELRQKERMETGGAEPRGGRGPLPLRAEARRGRGPQGQGGRRHQVPRAERGRPRRQRGAQAHRPRAGEERRGDPRRPAGPRARRRRRPEEQGARGGR
jgi:uncharacterized membrane protein YqiK